MANATGGIEPEGGRIWKRPNSPIWGGEVGTEALPGRCGDGGVGNKAVFNQPTIF